MTTTTIQLEETLAGITDRLTGIAIAAAIILLAVWIIATLLSR